MKTLALILLCGTALGQTVIRGTLNVVPSTTSSPTSFIELTPATAAFPCPAGQAALDKTSALCSAGGVITVDYGDGKGFVPLASTGPAGPQGPPGPAGPQGPPGTALTPKTCSFTMTNVVFSTTVPSTISGTASLTNCQ